MEVANTITYYDTAAIAAVKSVIVGALEFCHGANVIKLVMAVSYA
jgi:hypothetical protein